MVLGWWRLLISECRHKQGKFKQGRCIDRVLIGKRRVRNGWGGGQFLAVDLIFGFGVAVEGAV